jgi:uncharacterized protein YutE (UPF0331/DUF86 family)
VLAHRRGDASGSRASPRHSQETREAFDLLEAAGRLDASLVAGLKKMVEFRNAAVHDYQKLNLDIRRRIQLVGRNGAS